MKILQKQIDSAQLQERFFLYSQWLTAKQIEWVSDNRPSLPVRCTAKTRYRQKDAPCIIEPIDTEAVRVSFEQPQWAVAPGQSVVFYQDEVCLGGGIIQTAENLSH